MGFLGLIVLGCLVCWYCCVDLLRVGFVRVLIFTLCAGFADLICCYLNCWLLGCCFLFGLVTFIFMLAYVCVFLCGYLVI